MFRDIGFMKDLEGEYKSRTWTVLDGSRRDSYLPQGSQGLKAVTTANSDVRAWACDMGPEKP